MARCSCRGDPPRCPRGSRRPTGVGGRGRRDGQFDGSVGGKEENGRGSLFARGDQGVGDAHRWKPEPFGALADDPEYEQDAAKRDELLERERHCSSMGKGKGRVSTRWDHLVADRITEKMSDRVWARGDVPCGPSSPPPPAARRSRCSTMPIRPSASQSRSGYAPRACSMRPRWKISEPRQTRRGFGEIRSPSCQGNS